MIKILYIVSTLERTGPVNQLFNLLLNLDAKKFLPIVLTLSPEKENTKIDDFRDRQIQVQSLRLNKLSGLFNLKARLDKAIVRIKPDIIHTQGYRADTVIYKLHTDIPKILTIRTDPIKDYPNRYGRLLGSYMARAHIKAAGRCKNAVACSKSLSEALEPYLGRRIAFIQNAVDDKKYYPITEKDKYKLRKKLKLDVDKKFFVFVGPLDKGKNIGKIITSFSRLAEPSKMELLIIGNGPEKEKFLNMTAKIDSIRIVGRKTNVSDYYLSCDYFISASRYEGLPNSVLEAMACGLPVVLSAIAPHKEIFETLPSYPYFFDYENADAITVLAEKIVKDDYKIRSRQTREIIEKRFSVSKNAEKYMSLYRSLLN